jgi:hypothetical protein
MIPSDTQIDREIAFFGPGLGRMQAINRIRQREAILRDRRVGRLEPVEEPQFATVEAYWRDPAPFDAEAAANRAKANAHLDAHRDAALAKLGYI